MKFHITHTGRYAGTPFCGTPILADDKSAHLPYLTYKDGKLQGWVKEHVSCKACRKVFTNVYMKA